MESGKEEEKKEYDTGVEQKTVCPNVFPVLGCHQSLNSCEGCSFLLSLKREDATAVLARSHLRFMDRLSIVEAPPQSTFCMLASEAEVGIVGAVVVLSEG